MSKVATRTFCCCIPVRAGVVMLSLIGLAGGVGITALGILTLKRHEGSRVSAIIQTVVYLLLALVSIVGLVGAIIRKVALVRAFFGMLVAHLLFSIGTGIYAVFRSFKESRHYVKACINSSTSPTVIQTCHNGATLLKVISMVVFFLAWFFEIWAIVIVHNYGRQLAEEEATSSIVKDTENW
jgi:hypothetical protein